MYVDLLTHVFGPKYFCELILDLTLEFILTSFCIVSGIHFGHHVGTHLGPHFGPFWELILDLILDLIWDPILDVISDPILDLVLGPKSTPGRPRVDCSTLLDDFGRCRKIDVF